MLSPSGPQTAMPVSPSERSSKSHSTAWKSGRPADIVVQSSFSFVGVFSLIVVIGVRAGSSVDGDVEASFSLDGVGLSLAGRIQQHGPSDLSHWHWHPSFFLWFASSKSVSRSSQVTCTLMSISTPNLLELVECTLQFLRHPSLTRRTFDHPNHFNATDR